TGATGATGATGVTGATGAAGPAGASAYAYIYNEGPEIVPVEAPVSFSTTGAVAGGIVHAAGSQVIVGATGIYKVSFSISGIEPNQFTLFVNGAPVPGTTHGSGAGTQQNDGQQILPLTAGDAMTLVNHSSAAAVTLQTLTGGTQPDVNASLLVERLDG
ncbi:MAG: triple helix repeat-containing collagen, partial [Solirubrobacterales bacterium]|nr:triple helix repeat-containing collagen [Solirubrobacterales bacterium]